MERSQWFPEYIREKCRILVVEDNLLNQKLDAYLLGGWGLKYEICDNGQKAVDLLRTTPFDLVLMDIRMPVLNGYEATRIIRSQLALDVPVIGITAFPEDEERDRCISCGMNGYLAKPVDEKLLYSTIRKHILEQQVESAPEGEE